MGFKIEQSWSSATQMPRGILFWRYALFILLILIASLIVPELVLEFITTLAATIIFIMASLRLIAICIACLPNTRNNSIRTCPKTTRLKSWPSFTILVPLYKESCMVKTLMENLAKLEYPQDKLNIIMVCEADDRPTCRTVHAHLRPPFHIFEVPPSQPRTKPKALNATLASLLNEEKGDIVTIYDAEDHPHPLQLKAAALAFHANPNLCAVQAPLGYYNAHKNLLSKFFALEYAALFHVWNPALARLNLPFTLGGTSNHIRRDVLDAVGGWDAHNVTEDADLSFRMSALAGTELPTKIGCIGYGTQEEAVSKLGPWTHQRSRWLKGYMQTWAVHMRPQRAGPTGARFQLRTRLKNLATLQITIGATLLAAYLHVPSVLILIGISLAVSYEIIAFTPSKTFYAIMAFGYGTALLAAMVGAILERKARLILYSPFLLFYWLIHFPAALIAGYEFIFAPSKWRKTEHQGEQVGLNGETHWRTENLSSPLEDLHTPPI